MTDGTVSRRSPQLLPPVLAVIGTVLVIGAFVSMAARGRPLEAMYGHWMIHNGPTGVLALWLGHLVLRRDRSHRGGWLLVAIGVLSCVHVAVIALADARFIAAGVAHSGQRFEAVAPAVLPLDAMIPWWISAWLWVPIPVMATTVFMLIFPDGRLPAGVRRYGFHLAIAAAALISAAYMLETAPWSEIPIVMGDSIGATPLVSTLLLTGGAMLAIAVVLSISTLVARWRAADADQRHRMRPVVISATAFAVIGVGLFPLQWLWIPTALLAIWTLLGSYAFAIARYRLHDLDIVVSRAVVAALLAMTLTAVYLAIVVGVGGLIGRGRDATVLPLVAAGVVAVAFDPVRRRVQRLVDRLLYGHDRDAYEVLHGIADQLRSTAASDDVLVEVVGLLMRGTGAEQVDIVATGRHTDTVVSTTGRSDRESALWAVPIVHDGATLGRIRVFARSSADLAPGSAALVDDVAATIGVVLRNAQLTNDLREQVSALRLVGERLVHAQDEARRELERDLHDGAQAQLIALKIQLGMAERRAASVDQELAALIGSMSTEVDRAVRSLRELSHGLRPAVLEGGGIAAAIRSEARNLSMEVRVDDTTTHRYDPAVEAAVFFSCLEAIQNSAKHGGSAHVRVRLSNGHGGLEFSVSDDGTGFETDRAFEGAGLTNLEDRVTSLGGEFRVDSIVGIGTTVKGRIPVQPLVSER